VIEKKSNTTEQLNYIQTVQSKSLSTLLNKKDRVFAKKYPAKL